LQGASPGEKLFKNAQMQGAQELNREAYCAYIERCGLKRNTADERSCRALQGISTASLFLINGQISQPIGTLVMETGNMLDLDGIKGRQEAADIFH
jgi:hypothetical protein